MTQSDKWLLPDGVEELLPEAAAQLEYHRRIVLDSFALNGYKLVQPPLIEFIDSLLTGAGGELELLTFKLTDLQSGRLMGVRADMTPQISRIDAHLLHSNHPTRLCYLGPLLQTQYRSGFHSREPMQFGAELFGYSNCEADVEIIRLMTDVFTAMGINNLHLDLGHVGIFNALVQQSGINDQQSRQLLNICLHKSWPDMHEFVNSNQLDANDAKYFISLLDLEGQANHVFNKAQCLFVNADTKVKKQLNDFKRLVERLKAHLPDLTLTVDFLELRGIKYHTGCVFSVYSQGYSNAIAKGGRYDDVGAAFGKVRAATGFSADLRQCIKLAKPYNQQPAAIVYAPFETDVHLQIKIKQLRAQGITVLVYLPNEEIDMTESVLVKRDQNWIVTNESNLYGE